MTNQEALQVVVNVCEAHLCNGQDRNIIREALNTVAAALDAQAAPAPEPEEAAETAAANGRKRASASTA
jgi:hypothetical protein